MKREVDYEKEYFPKSYERECLEKMSIKELAEYQVSQIMNKMRRILSESGSRFAGKEKQ